MPYARRRFHPYYRRGGSPDSVLSSAPDDDDDDEEEQPQEECSRCGRRGHARADCYARTRANGAPLRLPDTRPARIMGAPSAAPAPGAAGVYALQDGAGRVYVGKSQHVAQRVRAHRAGDGTRFLDAASAAPLPLRTHGTPGEDLETWERNETLAQMHAHGVDNVRGWIFTTTGATRLTPPEMRASAVAQVCEKFDLCRRCGRGGHFATACYARSPAAWLAE